MKVILSTYENQTKKILDLEKKIQLQENFYIEKIHNYEQKYREQFDFINNLLKNSSSNISSDIKSNSNSNDIYDFNNNTKDFQNNKKADKIFSKFNSKNMIKEEQFSTLTIVRFFL